VIDFSDLMILGMAFPNVIGLYFLLPKVREDLRLYIQKQKK
jgi:AGCS family alanine or glycine:cation symporter